MEEFSFLENVCFNTSFNYFYQLVSNDRSILVGFSVEISRSLSRDEHLEGGKRGRMREDQGSKSLSQIHYLNELEVGPSSINFKNRVTYLISSE